MTQNAIHKARYWHPSADKDAIVCTCCPRQCELRDGQRGFCFSRKNTGGQLDLTSYGRVIGLCVDPIEKKPLNHFMPGTGVLSFGTAGCNLGCRFCQNWTMSKADSYDQASRPIQPDEIAEEALAQNCPSVAFTYNDPTIFTEYAMDVADACHERGIKTVAVSAGYIGAEARRDLYSKVDAANIDLKAFTDDFYQKLCLGVSLQDVLDTLLYIKHETSTWLEITTLLIPGENDSTEELMDMIEWIHENLGPDVPLHFSAFHPDFKMMHRPRTPLTTLLRARDIAMGSGMNYVYIGNAHHQHADSTWCPGCGKCVIERDWYQLGAYHLDGGKCRDCGYTIAGIFPGKEHGNHGPARRRVEM